MADDFLLSRAEDMLFHAGRGEAVHSAFLNESESALLDKYFKNCGEGILYSFWGGYLGAQRTRLFVYPDYYDFDELKTCIGAVKILGSGYEKLRHSSFLGALTSLGIDRSKLGDIVLRDEAAILFADENILKFLLSSPPPLFRVGRDKVRVVEYSVPADFENRHAFKDIFDTVSSPRLDCVVSALAGISREKAKNLILTGQVQRNYICEQRPDAVVSGKDTVTVHKTGKFIVVSVSEKTKKDRYKLIAKKYI